MRTIAGCSTVVRLNGTFSLQPHVMCKKRRPTLQLLQPARHVELRGELDSAVHREIRGLIKVLRYPGPCHAPGVLVVPLVELCRDLRLAANQVIFLQQRAQLMHLIRWHLLQ